jgi:hypothetical protein
VPRQQQRKFIVFETDQVQIVVGVLKRFDLEPQSIFIPTGVERQLVVCDNECPALVFVEAVSLLHQSALIA